VDGSRHLLTVQQMMLSRCHSALSTEAGPEGDLYMLTRAQRSKSETSTFSVAFETKMGLGH